MAKTKQQLAKEKLRKDKLETSQKKAKKKARESEWYGIRSLLAFTWCMFFVLLGAREAGKSYSVMEYFVKKWKQKKIPFYWIRLNEGSTKKLLANNAEKFVDVDIARKYGLEITVKGNNVYDHGEKMATIVALSTFYSDKGVGYYDKDFLCDPNMEYHVCLDEFEKEKNEKSQGDICYQFVNQMENLLRSTKERCKIFLIGNTLEEASDILTMFNFVPETFGRYKLVRNKKKLLQYLKELDQCKTAKEKEKVNEKYKDVNFGKRAVIDYIPNSQAYINRRKGTISDILTPSASTFTNEIEMDKSLISKQRLYKPQLIIKFSKDKKEWFTLWNNSIIAQYNGEQCKTVISMRPYLDLLFNVQQRDQIISLFDTRSFLYHNLITFKLFQKQIKLIKPRKQ